MHLKFGHNLMLTLILEKCKVTIVIVIENMFLYFST